MLGSVSGHLGTGKSLWLTYLAAQCHRQTPVFANFTLKLDNVKTIGVEDLETIEQGLILIDEAYLWLESRVSSSALNLYMSRIAWQSRKRYLDIFISSQLTSAIDKRYILLEDVVMVAYPRLPNSTDDFKYKVEGWGNQKTIVLPYKQAEELFPLFDSWKYPDVMPSAFEPKRYNMEINKLVKRIEDEYAEPWQMTQKMVKDYLIEHGTVESLIIDGVYARLKRKKLEAKDAVQAAKA